MIPNRPPLGDREDTEESFFEFILLPFKSQESLTVSCTLNDLGKQQHTIRYNRVSDSIS